MTGTPAYAATSYALSVSASSSRSGAVALEGATLAGNQYVFTSLAAQLTNFNPTGITQVCFWLDNVAMSGPATRCELAVPHDFAGGVNSVRPPPQPSLGNVAGCQRLAHHHAKDHAFGRRHRGRDRDVHNRECPSESAVLDPQPWYGERPPVFDGNAHAGWGGAGPAVRS